MEYLLSLGIEVISEIIGILIIAGYLMYQKKVEVRKLEKLRAELDLEKLNNIAVDEVLLINDMAYLNSVDGMTSFNSASIVLLKDNTQMYNTVIKNNYGSSGTINKK